MAESQPNRALPARPSIEWLKKTAKDQLREMRAVDPKIKLAETQRQIAKDYGFKSWQALVTHIKSIVLETAVSQPIDWARRFREALNNRDYDDLRTCLIYDAQLVNAPVGIEGSFGKRPIALANGHLPLIDFLIKHGADINLKSDWWAGPWGILDMADAETAEALIARGAKLDIFSAAHLNKIDALKEMLRDDPSLVHSKGGDGCRALHFAKSIEAIDLLLKVGAEIDARDVDHESTAAQWAMPRPAEEFPHDRDRLRGLDLVRAFVERGASTDIFMLAALNDFGRLRELIENDPAAMQAKVGGKNYAPCPVAPGKHIYVYKVIEGRTPFEVAHAFGSRECEALLFERATPPQRFLAACGTGDESTARQLLDQSPDLIGTLSKDDASLLANAAWAGDMNGVRTMLSMGFDLTANGPDSGTPLHCAAWQGRIDIVRLILAAAKDQNRLIEIANITEPTHQGTPLGWCFHGSLNCRNPEGDYPAIARLLLDAGAKPIANPQANADVLRAIA